MIAKNITENDKSAIVNFIGGTDLKICVSKSANTGERAIDKNPAFDKAIICKRDEGNNRRDVVLVFALVTL